MSVLVARGIVVKRGERVVVDGIDVDVHPGETVALAGVSGSGKSTLLGVLAGLEVPFAGVVRLDRTPLTELPATVVRARLGVVLQGLALLPHLTAAENVLVALRTDPTGMLTARDRGTIEASAVSRLVTADVDGRPVARGSGVLESEDDVDPGDVRRNLSDDQLAVLEALDEVGMGDRAHTSASRLSGGEQQRVALARALVRRPSVLLVDEPTSQLDAASRSVVLALLRTLTDDGTAVVVATHDEAVRAVCTRTVRLGD